MARIGLLGGSFDPIHIGHLALAEEARVALGLDEVLFVPAAQQPLKEHGHHATPEQRLEMVRLAVDGNRAFQVCEIELRRQGPSYTVETLAELGQVYGPGCEFFFIMGLDSLRSLPRWREPGRLIALAQLVVFERPGYALALEPLTQALPGLAERLTRLQGPRLDLSATELRARVAAGRPIRYLVPDAVAAYVAQAGLYRGER